MKAYDRAVNQQLSGNVTSAEINTDVASNVQLRGVQLYFVLTMVCTGRAMNRIANTSRSWRTKARRLLFQVYSPQERCKVGCADDGGSGSFDGHERRDLFKIIRRCFREFLKKQGLRVRVLVIREKVKANIRMSQDTDGLRQETVERVRG